MILARRPPVRTLKMPVIVICGLVLLGSANWSMNGDEFGAVGECRFHLHRVDHLRDAFHDLLAVQDLAALRHELGNRLAVARALRDEIRDQRDTLGVIELHAPHEPPSSNERRERDHELVLLTWREVHELLPLMAAVSTTTFSGPETDRVRSLGSFAREDCAKRALSRMLTPRQSARR